TLNRPERCPGLGILNNGSAASRTNYAFFQGLRELGYTEGQEPSDRIPVCGLATRSAPRIGGRAGCAKGRRYRRGGYAGGSRSQASDQINSYRRGEYG